MSAVRSNRAETHHEQIVLDADDPKPRPVLVDVVSSTHRDQAVAGNEQSSPEQVVLTRRRVSAYVGARQRRRVDETGPATVFDGCRCRRVAIAEDALRRVGRGSGGRRRGGATDGPRRTDGRDGQGVRCGRGRGIGRWEETESLQCSDLELDDAGLGGQLEGVPSVQGCAQDTSRSDASISLSGLRLRHPRSKRMTMCIIASNQRREADLRLHQEWTRSMHTHTPTESSPPPRRRPSRCIRPVAVCPCPRRARRRGDPTRLTRAGRSWQRGDSFLLCSLRWKMCSQCWSIRLCCPFPFLHTRALVPPMLLRRGCNEASCQVASKLGKVAS